MPTCRGEGWVHVVRESTDTIPFMLFSWMLRPNLSLGILKGPITFVFICNEVFGNCRSNSCLLWELWTIAEETHEQN